MTGVALSGLLYPMAIAALGVVGQVQAFIREPTHQVRIVGRGRRRSTVWVPDQP